MSRRATVPVDRMLRPRRCTSSSAARPISGDLIAVVSLPMSTPIGSSASLARGTGMTLGRIAGRSTPRGAKVPSSAGMVLVKCPGQWPSLMPLTVAPNPRKRFPRGLRTDTIGSMRSPDSTLLQRQEEGLPSFTERLNALMATGLTTDDAGMTVRWTNERLANRLGLAGCPTSASYIKRLRSGTQKNPSGRLLLALLIVFGAPAAYFFDSEVAAAWDERLRGLRRHASFADSALDAPTF